VKINLQSVPGRFPEEVAALVDSELLKIGTPEVLEGLKFSLIKPRIEFRWWDWQKPAKQYPVWIVAESSVNDYGIDFTDYGFGPEQPWGLVFLSKENFDADYCWYGSLGEAYLRSRLIEEFVERRIPQRS